MDQWARIQNQQFDQLDNNSSRINFGWILLALSYFHLFEAPETLPALLARKNRH